MFNAKPLSFLAAGLFLALPADSSKPFNAKLGKEQQALHAVDRLSFGGSPAELARAKKMGVEKWIEEQLHPERIPENPLLAAKLADLAALQMPAAELFKTYPPRQVIAQFVRGNQPLPQDPLLRHAIALQVERYKVKKSEGKQASEEMEQRKQDDKPGSEASRQKVLAVLEPDQARVLRSGTADEKRALLAALPEAKVDQLLLALPVPARRALSPVATTSIRRKIVLLSQPQQVIAYDLNESKLQRAIYSTRQLDELMADFWFNHFNVYLDKGADRHLVPSYEREAIRPNALGKFGDLLQATASHPAMLFYLDNWQSVGVDSPMAKAARKAFPKKNARGLNENYARELLELHTLGVEGGYTQKDVTEVARCFTGWTITAPRAGADFNYNDRIHDKGEKTVLGVTIPAGGGKSDGEKVLEIVRNHPSTARFISRKLAVRFVADDAPEELIAAMAKTFRDTGGDIRAVLRAMFLSREFLSESAFRAKVKTPFEMAVSAARALGARVDFAGSIAQRLSDLGQPLYRKVEPTGYSSRNEEWINSAALLGRMNFALALAQNKVPGVHAAAPAAASRADLEAALIPAGLSASTRATIDAALNQKEAKPEMLAGLLLGSPEFQRR